MMPKPILIADKRVGNTFPPFIIAEMSGNHNQSLERALEIVEAAARTGAHAIKLQTYTADTMTLDLKEREFFISDEKSPWKGQSLYDLYKIAHTPWEWHKPIFERAKIIPVGAPITAISLELKIQPLGLFLSALVLCISLIMPQSDTLALWCFW